jgi:hypothetical protein
MFPDDPIIKRGQWMYGGSAPLVVVITRGKAFLGSGDPEDSLADRDDREVETFRLWFESPPGSNAFPACSGQFFSIEEAMEAAAKLLPSPPRWE